MNCQELEKNRAGWDPDCNSSNMSPEAYLDLRSVNGIQTDSNPHYLFRSN
jgi:hypothetical protein